MFLDGCFWHGCPEHHTKSKTNESFWAEKVAQTRLRDRETDRLLTESGWLVVRVWEHEKVEEAALRVAQTVLARQRTWGR